MKTLLIYILVVTLGIPQNFALAAGGDGGKHSQNVDYTVDSMMGALSLEDPILFANHRAEKLQELAKAKLPQMYTLDSSFDRHGMRTSSIQSYIDEKGKDVPVKIETISVNGVWSDEEKLSFLSEFGDDKEAEKAVEKIRAGKLEVITYFPEDLERAHAAKAIREEMGKSVMLIPMTHSMANYFNKIAEESTRSFANRTFTNAMNATKNSAVFLKDAGKSALTMKLEGEFKKYVNTVVVPPTRKDDHMATIFTGINTGFTSAVFIGLNMDHAAFTGFLSLSVFTTLILTRYWRTVNSILKTDISNPFKYASAWRQVFARVAVIGTATTLSQFAMGAHLKALQYLPSQSIALGNVASVGLGDAYFATKRNRVLTPEAAATVSLYSYVLMSLPSRSVAQYAKDINFSDILAKGGETIDLLWHPIRNWTSGGSIIEFTGVSLFILGSYVVFAQILKWKAHSAEKVASDGFLKYLFKKMKKEPLEPGKPLTPENLRTKQNYVAKLLAQNKNKAPILNCKDYFAAR